MDDLKPGELMAIEKYMTEIAKAERAGARG